jgi:hypothetical protein
MIPLLHLDFGFKAINTMIFSSNKIMYFWGTTIGATSISFFMRQHYDEGNAGQA